MFAMFRKQCRNAVLPALLYVVLSVILCLWPLRGRLATDALNADIAPFVAAFGAVFGCVVGFAGFGLEDAHGTREYWLHRGLSPARTFAMKTAAELVVLTIAFALVWGGDAVVATILHDPSAAPGPMYSRYGALALAWTATPAAHAVGSLGAQIRRSVRIQAVCTLAACVGGAILTVAWQERVGDRILANEAAWLSWTLGSAAALYALAVNAFERGADGGDRPFSGATRPVFALTLIALAGPACMLLPAVSQSVALSMAFVDSAPVVFMQSERVGLLHGHEDSDEAPRVLTTPDYVFRPSYREDARESDEPFDWNKVTVRRSAFRFGADWLRLVATDSRLSRKTTVANGASFGLETWLQANSGRVLAVASRVDPANFIAGDGPGRRASGSVEFPYRRFVDREDGRAFSRNLVVLTRGDRALLCDRADRTLWLLDLQHETPTLSRVALPDDDEWIGIDTKLDRRVVASRGRYVASLRGEKVLVGKRGVYRWTHGPALTRAWLGAHDVLGSESTDAVRIVRELKDADVLRPHVVVRDVQSGEVHLDHRYPPAESAALVAHFAGLFRSPLGGVASFLDSSVRRPVDLELIKDPLLADGRRAWLLALNIVLCLSLAAWFASRRRLGLRWTWFVVLALLGPSVAAIAWGLEPPARKSAARRPRPRVIGSARELQSQPSA